MGFAKIRADGSYLQLFVILLCFISGWTLSIYFLLLSSLSVFNQQQFRAESWSIPQLHKAAIVVRNPKRHPANIYASMTFPTQTHAIFSKLQGTQNADTKPTLQRAKNANALPTHPGLRISINICSTHQLNFVLQ